MYSTLTYAARTGHEPGVPGLSVSSLDLYFEMVSVARRGRLQAGVRYLPICYENEDEAERRAGWASGVTVALFV